MKIIKLGLGEGKTTALLQIMLEPGNEDVVFITPTFAQMRVAQQMMREMKGVRTLNPKDANRFRTLQNLLGEGWHYPSDQRYVIDNLEGVIGGLVGGDVIAVSGTDERDKKAYFDNLNRKTR